MAENFVMITDHLDFGVKEFVKLTTSNNVPGKNVKIRSDITILP